MKYCLKSNLEEIKNLFYNQTFLVQYSDRCEPVTPCMDVYKAKIQSNESLDKLKLSLWLEEICIIMN